MTEIFVWSDVFPEYNERMTAMARSAAYAFFLASSLTLEDSE